MDKHWASRVVILILVIGLFTFSWSEAFHKVDLVPIFTSAKVDTVVSYDPTGGLYTYEYILTNPTSNTGKINYFEMDISLPASSLLLPSTGLTLDEGDLPDGTRYRLLFEESAADFQSPPVDPAYVPAVPVGTQMPFAAFSSGVRLGAGLYWMLEPYALPGTSYGPLQVFSYGLPTIRKFVVSPLFYPDLYQAEDQTGEEFTYEMTEELHQIEEQLAVKGRTLGPTAPPAAFDPLTFTGTIQGYLTESQTLGWLTDATLISTLTGHLNVIAAAIPLGDIATANLRLQEFIAALPVPPIGTAACTSECAGLLVFNAQYLLDHLPTDPDLVIHGLSAATDRVVVGVPFPATATVRNQGGGTADPTTLRLLLSSDSTIDLTDHFVADISTPLLEMGQIQTLVPSITIPATIPLGTYTFGVCADATETLVELFETNNCRADRQMRVVFNQYGLIVTKSGSGSGTVTSNPAGIHCGSDCSEVYNKAGYAWTNSAQMPLVLGCIDPPLGTGCTEMQFSDDGVTFTPFEPFVTNKTITFPSGDGVKRIYARFKDGAGNLSAITFEDVVLDTTSPIVSGASDMPDPFNPHLGEISEIHFTVSDSLSMTCAVEVMITDASNLPVKRFRSDVSCPPDGAVGVITWDGKDSFNAGVPAGVYTYRIVAFDNAGNISETQSGTTTSQ